MIYTDESFTTFKRAATDAITGGYVDEWLDSFNNFDDYWKASDAVDEINEEMYEWTHNNK